VLGSRSEVQHPDELTGFGILDGRLKLAAARPLTQQYQFFGSIAVDVCPVDSS